ncbi:MAG: aldo/keto reductase [Actinomycetia bacterium]|jgi:aryl-alcohol dehydrogenase-like predicted oxidoreductase|nr:aldo/keto reductase [Actinomycetes bacterium]
MEQRRVGGSGLQVSRIGLGTMTWGRDTDEHEARDQLAAFLEAGGTLVDTAVSYGEGASELTLGRLLDDVVPRGDVVVATKTGLRYPGGRRTVDTSRRAMLHDLEDSLTRLGTDHVDLWQVHTWSAATPLEETLAALDDAVAAGKVRYVGVSNLTGWQTAQAATWQRAWPDRVPLVSTQVEYSLLQRGIEREVLPAAQALGLGVLPWSPLGRGVLTGKYRTGIPADSRAASPHFSRFVEPYLAADGQRIVTAVATAADGLGLAPLEVALAWVRDRPGVVAPIVGARTAAQLRGILAADDITLPAEIRQVLDEVSEPTVGYPERGPDQS